MRSAGDELIDVATGSSELLPGRSRRTKQLDTRIPQVARAVGGRADQMLGSARVVFVDAIHLAAASRTFLLFATTVLVWRTLCSPRR